jgi:hypothetical protein
LKASDRVKSNFDERLSKATECHRELMLAVHNKLNQAALETMLVEQFAILAAIQWESFLNDLIIAYAMMSPKTALKGLEERIEKSVQDKFGERAAKCVTFAVKQPFTLVKISKLLDPKDYNITFKSASELTSKANDILTAKFAKRFSLDKTAAQFVDFEVALRNFLSHRSDSSRNILKNSIDALSEAQNLSLKASIRNMGTYLKAKDANGKTRAVIFAERLVEISKKL